MIAAPGEISAHSGTAARPTARRPARPRGRAVAIGTFDGVHRGHARVIAGCDTVLTFDPHPRSVLQPDRVPRLLADAEGRRRRIAALGVREIVVIPFDRAWAAVDAAAFVDELIIARLGARSVSVGADFRFGAGAAGDARALAADPRFITTVAPMTTVDGEVVSSSRIRALVAAGDVERAARLLGRPHTLPARIAPNGRLTIDPALATPPPGRYAVTVAGATTRVTLLDHGVIEPVRGSAGWARSAEVSFLGRT
jgi:riboflavin kinase / FMN adenylyltransferase